MLIVSLHRICKKDIDRIMKNYFRTSLLLLLIVSCIGRPAGQENRAEAWRAETELLNGLLQEKKEPEAIEKAKGKINELLSRVSAEDTTQADYAAELVSVLIRAYTATRNFPEGLSLLDSLSRVPYIQKNCPYDLYACKAYMNQLMGNNEKAIECADEYLQLPECKDDTRYILNAEAVSGVYAYCSNDMHKAIRVLEGAVERYRKGGKYPHILRLVSRLGIYYRLMGEYEKASAINQEAISSYNDSLPPQEVVIAYGEQSNLYAALGLYKEALQYNTMAVHYASQKDSFGLGDVYRYRADLFLNTGPLDSVFHYLRLGEQVSTRQRSFRGVLVNKIQQLKSYLEEPDSVQRAVQLGRTLCADTARIPKWAKYQFELYFGKAFLKAGDTAQAIPLIKDASRGFATMDMVNMEYEANDILLEHFRQHAATDEFMYYYNRNRLFADSLKTDEKLRAMAASNIRFGTALKEKENERLSLLVEMQQRHIFYDIYVFVTLVLFLGGAIAYILRKRKTNRVIIERSRQEIERLISSQRKLNQHNEELAKKIEQLTANNNLTPIHQLVCQSLLSKEDENAFRQSFATIYPYYLPSLRRRYPQVTRNEELLAMLICMGQNTDEIALVLGINRTSVNVVRSRMRKNLGLSKEESLDEVVKQFLQNG